MTMNEESIRLQILKRLYPHYDKDRDIDIMDLLRAYQKQLRNNEKINPSNKTQSEKDISILLKIGNLCLSLEEMNGKGMILTTGEWHKLGNTSSGRGKAQSIETTGTLENINPIRARLTEKGYQYIKDIIDKERKNVLIILGIFWSAAIGIFLGLLSSVQYWSICNMTSNQKVALSFCPLGIAALYTILKWHKLR